MASPHAPRHFVIEGPPGAGKAGLAGRLAESLDGELMVEDPRDNPFLPRFYENHRQAALPAQLFILFQRARVLDRMRQSDLFRSVHVTDFLMDKEWAFAERVLDASEFELYRQVYQTLDLNPPSPDLVVYLQAPPDVLMRRITERGFEWEKAVNLPLLARLCEAYADFFHQYVEAPLLIVNAAQIDPVQREPDYQELLGAISGAGRGRQFFNPAATTLA